MWWPQRNFDRPVVWQAERAPFDPQRKLRPYREIARLPVASQVAASIVYTLLGNLERPEQRLRISPACARRAYVDWAAVGRHVRRLFSRPADPSHVKSTPSERHNAIALGSAWLPIIEYLVTASDALLAGALQLRLFRDLVSRLASMVPDHIDTILGPFVSTGKDGAPAIQEFCDRAFTGLPLDNQMDDLLMPTWFTELWVPFTPGDGRIQETITRLRKHFDADGSARGAYAATGAFVAFELYVAKADEQFFLSPAADQHAFRVDVFWFAHNQGNPVTDFFPQFWRLLEPIGYRMHWGKFLPPPDPARSDRLTASYPKWPRWKAVRERVDPAGVFLTKYWRDHLGL